MKVTISLTDKGAQTVEFGMDSTVSLSETERNIPTPAAVFGVAIKAMFNNGLLAKIGQKSLEGMSKGISPEKYLEECVKIDYTN